jgi:predicted RNA binding protein YcfA (HicA-like mRNA interferase family)
MADYGDYVRRLLSGDGYEKLPKRGKGSHSVWYNGTKNITVTVNDRIKSRHSANEILKDAKVNHKF